MSLSDEDVIPDSEIREDEDNILPDEDGAINVDDDSTKQVAEANENVIAVIMAQQAKSLARTNRLNLTQELTAESDDDNEDLDTLMESRLGLSEVPSKPEVWARTKGRQRAARNTNIPNETPAPFMSMQLILPEGPRPDRIVREIWLKIIGPLPDRAYCALAAACRYFRQLLQQYRTGRVAACVDRSNLFKSVLRVIRDDDADLLQVMCARGDVADANVAAVHALHHRSIRCISYLQEVQHDLGNAFIEILKLDDVNIFKILRQRGAEITDDDIGQIVEYDALGIFSYLMHLIDPRMLLSVELDRTPASMTEMMLHAGYHCSHRIMGYLRSLGVAFVPPPDEDKTPKLPVPEEPSDLPLLNDVLPTDEGTLGSSLGDTAGLTVLVKHFNVPKLTNHQYSAFRDIHYLRAMAKNEDRIIGSLRLYHQPGSNLPRLNNMQLQNILLSTAFRTFKTLLDLGYTDIVKLFTRVERTYRIAPNMLHHGLPDEQETFEPIIDPERELYIAEVLKQPLTAEIVSQCIGNAALFRRLHELGMRADGERLIFDILSGSVPVDRTIVHDTDNSRVQTTIAMLRLVHSLGYDRSDIPVERPGLPIPIVCELLNRGYVLLDTARTSVGDWDHLTLPSNEIEALYRNGYHWAHDVIKRCLDKDRVNMIAATVNLGIWNARTNIMLWVIASRAQACFEYLIHKETLPYAAQAFRFVKDPILGSKRTNVLSDDFPIDWLCLAFYMPWPWFVTWIRERASPNLLDKIKTNAREWSRTQGLDRLIPPGWHDIRNFIAKRLVVDGRPRLTRDLIEGKEVSMIMFED